MALCGPRGVKFGLNAKQSFVLLARISDKVDPFNVLSMAESFWRLPGMFAAIVSEVLIYHGNHLVLSSTSVMSISPSAESNESSSKTLTTRQRHSKHEPRPIQNVAEQLSRRRRTYRLSPLMLGATTF